MTTLWDLPYIDTTQSFIFLFSPEKLTRLLLFSIARKVFELDKLCPSHNWDNLAYSVVELTTAIAFSRQMMLVHL